MNHFNGHITKLQTGEQLILIEVEAQGLQFTGVLMDQEGYQGLEIGQPISVMFNATELFLAKDLAGEISIRNRFHGTVRQVDRGEVLSKITLQCGQADLVSIITTASAERLGCQPGAELTALLKTNELLFDLNPTHE
ncbi:MAG: TOBE domain-containing protein [Bacteroidota bacterium]